MKISPRHIAYISLLAAALTLVGTAAVFMACAGMDSKKASRQAGSPGQLAPRLQNLGNHQFPVTTDSERAQLFINQAMILSYGFNHREAHRSFKEAARLDPDAAMAYWGMALVLGPNINLAMAPEAEPEAYALIQKAIGLKGSVSEKERTYIDALSTRYSNASTPDRPALDRAYAAAMGRLSERYPDDLDAATLFAEAMMDLSPWSYWSRDYRPYPDTLVIKQVLESVLERNPKHPGANHLYIHLVEYARPDLAESAAERLENLAPGAGHLVHMPSHIYRRIGRYQDASNSNVAAIAADEDYIVQCRAQGVYPLAYYPHNVHFLWDSASMQGRSRLAIEAARKAATRVPEGAWREVPLLHQFLVTPLFAYTRFGQWDAVLAEPRPPEDSLFWTGIWHYARGMAFTAKGSISRAEAELERLKEIAGRESMRNYRVTFSRNGARAILEIADEVLGGEIAAKRGDFIGAVAGLHRAALLEDNLIYNEPPDWHVPVRQALGAVLLKAGRPAEAEAVYWQDLERNRENGWALFGLMQSLRLQGKDEQAAAVAERFERAWEHADIELTASRFIGDG